MPLRLYRRPGSRLWYVRGTVRGRHIFETCGTADQKEAELYRSTRETRLYEASIFGERAIISYAQAGLSYLEEGDARSSATERYVQRLITHFGSRLLAEIAGEAAQAELDGAIAAILRPGAAPATKNRVVRTPHVAVLNHAARRGWCSTPRLERKREPKGKTRWLTPDEALRLLDATAPRLKPLLTLFLCTGARVSEALELRWEDVDLPAAKIVLRDTKNGMDRVALLPTAAVAALASMGGARTGPVFRRDDGMPYADQRREQGGQIKTAFRAACRRAGLGDWIGEGPARRFVPNVTPHDLRHTFASYFYAITKDLKLLQAEGGWLSLSMVERYSHLMPSALVPEIRHIWGNAHPRIGALPRSANSVQPGIAEPKSA